jgi:hypothetical protein
MGLLYCSFIGSILAIAKQKQNSGGRNKALKIPQAPGTTLSDLSRFYLMNSTLTYSAYV